LFPVFLILDHNTQNVYQSSYLYSYPFYNATIKEGIVEAKKLSFCREKERIRKSQTQKNRLTEEEIKNCWNVELRKIRLCAYTPNGLVCFSYIFAGIRISDVLQNEMRQIWWTTSHYTMNKNEKHDLKFQNQVQWDFGFYRPLRQVEIRFLIFPI